MSTNENFIPSFGVTDKAKTQGDTSLNVSNLKQDQSYYAMIVATDEDGNESWGNKLLIKTLKKDAKIKNVIVNTQTASNQAQVSTDSVTFNLNNNQVPKAGSFITSSEGEGYLRKITSATENNGVLVAKTKSAALNEVFEELAISTTILLEDLPDPTDPSLSNSLLNAKINNIDLGLKEKQVIWKTGLTLSTQEGATTSSKISPLNNRATSTSTSLSKLSKVTSTTSESIEIIEDEGDIKIFSLPSYAAVAPENRLAIPFNFKSNGSICKENCYYGTRINSISVVCDVELKEFTHPDKTKEELSKPTVLNDSAYTYSFSWIPKEEQLDDEPYLATFEAKIGTPEQCAANDMEEVLSLEIPIYVSKGNPSIHFNSENISYGEENGITVNNTFNINFDPDIKINVDISSARLKSAEFNIKGDLSIKQSIQVDAIGVAERTIIPKEPLFKKSFSKIILTPTTPPVPIYVRGSVTLTGKFEIKAAGKIEGLKETFKNNHKVELGIKYDGKWSSTATHKQTYDLTFEGAAHAGLDLKFSIIPTFDIHFYDVAGAEILLEPYAYSDLTLSGLFTSNITDKDYLEDVDYSLNSFNVGGGANAYFYAGAGIFDKTIISYPKDVDYNAERELEEKIKSYEKFILANRTEILGLPKLSINENKALLPSSPQDSRSIMVKGTYINPGNISGFWAFDKWIEPKMIDYSIGKGVRLNTDKADINDGNNKGEYWFIPKKPGNYTARLRGYSVLGRYARQIIETELNAEDNDGDEISDYWESRFNINDPKTDPDKDCLTNLQEFQQGKFPNKKDSGDDSCNTPTELKAPTLNNLFTLINGVATIDWNTIQSAEKYTVYFSDKPSVSATQHTQKFTTTSLSQNISGIIDNKKYYAVVVAQNETAGLTSALSNEIGIGKIVETVTLSLGADFQLQEQKTKVIPFTIKDTEAKISTIGCTTNLTGITLNNNNRKVTITAPSFANTKSFSLSCIARDAQKKPLANDTVQITVTEEPSTNQPPTASLPSQAVVIAANNVIKPQVNDESVNTLVYNWTVKWDTGATNSGSSSTFPLTVPTLAIGEFATATVSLTVTDDEGFASATANASYTFGKAISRSLRFDDDNFVDNSVLARGSNKTLTWKITNKSNVILKDTRLALGSSIADKLTVSTIQPASIAEWAIDEQKTFTATVDVPNDITQGTHYQRWDISVDGKTIPYTPSGVSAYIDFSFKTENPNDLIGRLILDRTSIQPNETVKGLVEITNGNEPYRVEINWGDGSTVETYNNLAKNTDKGIAESYSHTYTTDGSYALRVKVVDNANKEAIFNDIIKVSSTISDTAWQVDVHDIQTDEREVDVNISIVDEIEREGVKYGQYRTNWQPTVDTTSKEYFVKYRLPVPSGLLKLDKKMRFSTTVKASGIAAHDREINLRTSDSKEYTASVREESFEETLADGTLISGGYFTTKDVATGQIVKEAALLRDDAIGNKTYALGTDPTTSLLSIYAKNNNDYAERFSKNIALADNFVTELNVTFKGNGQLNATLLEYDVNGDGEFGANEKVLLNTSSKAIDWSVFKETSNLVWTPEMSNNKTYYNAGICEGDPKVEKITLNANGSGSFETLVGSDGSENFTHLITNAGALNLIIGEENFDLVVLSKEDKYVQVQDPKDQMKNRFYYSLDDATSFANSTEATSFEICGGGSSTAITNLVSGRVKFIDNGSSQPIPSDTWIRIVPSRYQTEGVYTGVNCKITSEGNFGNTCYITRNETVIREAFNDSSETFQVIVYKDVNGDKSFNANEKNYGGLGNNAANGAWNSFDISGGEGESSETNDTALLECINKQLGISATATATPTQLESITSLKCNGSKIVDISVLSSLTNLQDLDLGSNQISDMSTLPRLTNLQYLRLYDNKISDISTLSSLTNLQYLNLGFNQISDISALSGLTNLQNLGLYNNKISDMSALSKLTNLKTLSFGHNNISDISVLSGLTNLQSLGLDYNKISDMSVLSGLTNLQSLSLENNQISDISTLPRLTNLQSLSLENNQISDISTLPRLTNLQYLGLGSNQISDMSALSKLTSLKTLDLNNNQISDISTLPRLTNLQSLSLENNQISDISVLSGLTNLQSLSLYNNKISDISVLSGLTNLQGLNLNTNQISDVSALSSLTNLILIRLHSNCITDFSSLPAQLSLVVGANSQNESCTP